MIASVASWSMETSSVWCINGVFIAVEFLAYKVISQIILTFKCHKNGFNVKNPIDFMVVR